MVISKNIEQNKDMKTSRVTKAIANPYKKYPLILNELMKADLNK